MKGLAWQCGLCVAPSVFLCSAGVFNAIRIKRMPSNFLPRLDSAIIGLLLFLHGLAVTLKSVMSKDFAIDIELFHLYLHLQILETGRFLETHQPRALDMLLS
jgi:hypothetical protein